jgi:hypothetical protein
MFPTLKNSCNWLPGYLINAALRTRNYKPRHLFFAICDHFEPYGGDADSVTARKRIGKWIDKYPKIAEKFRDADGKWLRYSFFYPAEEYKEADMHLLAELCKGGYGEVEVHLHHDNDTADNLRRTLLDFKRRLHEMHGLLSIDKVSGDISYAFIHGNWALGNSRLDGRWCGVNDEITVLRETGCYADFTMPSAPSETQTRKINSIYYAVEKPGRPKSHDTGIDVAVGRKGQGLLMVQGPLGLNWRNRKYGVFPKLENSGLYPEQPVTHARIKSWINERISVKGVSDTIFVKLYNHGAVDEMIEMFLEKGGLRELLTQVIEVCKENSLLLHFVTARQMANAILSFESNLTVIDDEIYNFRFVQCQ